MKNDQTLLSRLTPSRDFFVGIDSDGCVFDSMEIKHKECFCPAFINHMELQPVARYARETWEFVNLYSTTRGCNRFLALIRTLDLLARRPEPHARQVSIPRLQGVRDWITRERRLSNGLLAEEVQRNPDPDLARALAWSEDVNRAVVRIVRNIPPFTAVPACLATLTTRADAVVVSQTPVEDLRREWQEHRIDGYVMAIAGQEMGTKSDHLITAAKGRYALDKTLLLGDAPGDQQAAEECGALFYPIIPGREEESWVRFREQGLQRFFAGTFTGKYAAQLAEEFSASLPAAVPWKEMEA